MHHPNNSNYIAQFYHAFVVCVFVCNSNVWQFPLLIKGAKKPLEPGEIWNLPRFDTLEHALNEFDSIEAKLTSVGTNGNNETNSKSRSGSKKASVSLSKILWHQARGLTFSAIFAMLISSIPSLLMPYFIKYLSLFYENKNNNYDNIWYGISICIIWFLSSMIRLLLDNYVWICMGRVYVRTNMETKALIYRKSICMSLYSRNQSNTGQTVNLMSQDSQKVASIMAYGLVILSYFTVTLTCLGLLFVETGIAAIPGFLVLIVSDIYTICLFCWFLFDFWCVFFLCVIFFLNVCLVLFCFVLFCFLVYSLRCQYKENWVKKWEEHVVK